MSNFSSDAGSDLRSGPAIAFTPAGHDDRILPETRWIGGLISLVLFTAWIVLYLLPTMTTELFAWTIKPTMSAMFMGAAYGAGSYYFARLFLGKRWHHFMYYFPGIATFTWCMAIATFLHWDKFNTGHISFWTWLFLYVTTPFLVPLLFLRNRTDSGAPELGDVVVPSVVRIGAAIAGAILLLVGVALFVFPEAMIPGWPWQLTPLTARVVGGFLAAPGVTLLLCSRDPRWSAWRIFIQHSVLAVALLLVAVARAWSEFNTSNPITWVFVVGISLYLAAIIVVMVYMDRRHGGATTEPEMAEVRAQP